MNKLRATINLITTTAIGCSLIFLSSCRSKSMDGMVVFSRIPGKLPEMNFTTGEFPRYLPKTQIVAFNPTNPEESLKILTADFYSASSPEISYDGKYLLFSGQKNSGSIWQIWEMNLSSLRVRQITNSTDNCSDPCYLPNGRLLFSTAKLKDNLGSGHLLYTCNTDGSDILKITFNPGEYFATNVLKDGRLLTISRQILPVKKEPFFIVLRPDGTKAELFYNGIKGSTPVTAGRQTNPGNIVFIESENGNLNKTSLISISYNRPLHSRVNLTSGLEGDFLSVLPTLAGDYLISYRPSQDENFGLSVFDPVKKSIDKILFASKDFEVLEAVQVQKHDRPKKLPSEVDMGVKTGLLMCQDINFNTSSARLSEAAIQAATNIQVMGIDSAMGNITVEKDGSFYLKVIADTPFRIQTTDAKGNIVSGPGAWIWLRPNERRGCVGCHEDPEMVPINRLPIAVSKPPVNVPVHINKVIEKKVSLE